jgi:hypothetical protein
MALHCLRSLDFAAAAAAAVTAQRECSSMLTVSAPLSCDDGVGAATADSECGTDKQSEGRSGDVVTEMFRHAAAPSSTQCSVTPLQPSASLAQSNSLPLSEPESQQQLQLQRLPSTAACVDRFPSSEYSVSMDDRRSSSPSVQSTGGTSKQLGPMATAARLRTYALMFTGYHLRHAGLWQLYVDVVASPPFLEACFDAGLGMTYLRPVACRVVRARVCMLCSARPVHAFDSAVAV